ncbi:MAG: universal stress protein [Sedimentisphaerales bacterium]|nr:universal stress protein [Sedimentisphaerales bacterium]
MRFKKILFPTDFSKHSLYALPYAKDLVSRFDGELHVVHVVDDAYQYMMTASEVATVPVVMPLDGMRKTAQHQIQELQQEQLADLGDRVHAEVLVGRPFVEIIRYAREKEMDLIVIATHGHGALASMLLGSVTEKVVRKCECPVLTIRHPEQKFEAP